MKRYLNFLWNNKATVFLCGILIIFSGYFALTYLPESIFPDISFPKVAILVHNEDLPVQYMLVGVTKPLEEAARSEPGVKLVRSQTGNGLSKIHVYFNSNVNPKIAYLRLYSRIAKVSLPPHSNVSVRLMEPNIYPFAEYALVSNKVNSSNMMPFYYFHIKPMVLSVNGVYKIEETSRGWPEINIALDPMKLLQYEISPQDVINSFVENQGPFFSGVMKYFNQQFLLSTTNMPDNPKELSNLIIPVKSNNNLGNIPLALGNIAKINVTQPPLMRDAKVSGYKHALIMDILSQNKANEVKTSKELSDVMQKLKNKLPSGVSLVKVYDLSDLIKSNLNDVWAALVVGSLISLAVVLLFIGRFDGAISVFIVVPLSLSLTFTALYLMGFGLNIMTLGGICASIGAMIDHAIVIIERGLKDVEGTIKQRMSNVFERLKDILVPMSLATLTSTIVFIPLIFLPGTLGLLFKSMAISIIIALISSQLIALTFTPILSIFLARKNTKNKKSKSLKLYFFYSHALIFFMRRPWISIFIILITIAVGYVSFKNLPTAFLPSWDEGLISVPFRTPVGSSIETTTKVGELLMREAKKNTNIKRVSLMVGRGFGNAYSTPNKGILMIVLKNKRKESTQKVMIALDKKFRQVVPGLIALNSSQVLVNRLGDLSGSHAPLEVFLFGSNPSELLTQGQKLYNALAKVKDFQSVTFKSASAGPEIEFHPNYYGSINNISSYNLANEIKLYFWGENAGFLLKGEQIFPIRVTLQNKPLTINDIKSLNIIDNNKPINLNTISNIIIKTNVPYITHQNLVPYSYIWVKPYSHVGLSAAADEIKSVLRQSNLPDNISYSIGGYYKKQVKSFDSMYLILTIVLFTLLILFGLQFSSQKCALVAIITISSTASFALLSLLVSGIDLDSTAFLGILLVFAIVVNNVILIFSRSRQLNPKHSPQSVALAAKNRLRPIVMTMIADIFGFLPLAIGIGRGTDLLKPLAVATIGGLVFGAFASLILAPSLFCLLSVIISHSSNTTSY